MLLPEVDKSYRSEIDQFLEALAQAFPAPSESQKKEIEKFRRITKLRDESKQ